MVHTLKPAKGSRPSRKRRARGNSAGLGTTAGRGTKGQQARTGKGRRFGFEGGQTPLLRRQPKLRGFRSPNKVAYEALNLSDCSKLPAGQYSLPDLVDRGMISGKKPVKILGNGKLEAKVSLEVHAASAKAIEAFEQAGGSLTILS